MRNFMYRLIVMKPRLIFYTDKTYTKYRWSNKIARWLDRVYFKISVNIWHYLIYKPFRK